MRSALVFVKFVELFGDGVVALGPLELGIEPPRFAIKLIGSVMKVVATAHHFGVLDASTR